MSVSTGDPAPPFELDSDAKASPPRVSLKDYAGSWLVLYFYPRDNTPGCTRQAQELTQAAAALGALGASIVGISKDSVRSHCGFRDKWQITFPLLSDSDLTVHKAYGAWGTKVMYGKSTLGTLRSTFLIAPDGKVARAWKSVKVEGHADQVIDALREARGDKPRPADRTEAKKAAPASERKPKGS